MINNSEQSEMTEEQWGGRPGRIAHDPAFQKLLTFEYARVIYVTIAMFANDATACIDRMVPNISSLVARKHRVTPNVIKAHNVMIKGMEHYVKIKHCVPKGTYKQESDNDKFAGEIQRKADPVYLWNVESQTLLKAHKLMHNGVILPSADGNRGIKKTMMLSSTTQMV